MEDDVWRWADPGGQQRRVRLDELRAALAGAPADAVISTLMANTSRVSDRQIEDGLALTTTSSAP